MQENTEVFPQITEIGEILKDLKYELNEMQKMINRNNELRNLNFKKKQTESDEEYIIRAEALYEKLDEKKRRNELIFRSFFFLLFGEDHFD